MSLQIKPVSELHTECNEFATLLRSTDQPNSIIKNGEGDTVLMNPCTYPQRKAIVQHRRRVLEAEANRLNDAPTCSAQEMRNQIRDKFAAARQNSSEF